MLGRKIVSHWSKTVAKKQMEMYRLEQASHKSSICSIFIYLHFQVDARQITL